MTDLAPIALFAFRRPDHLASTLEALERTPEFARSQVYIFSDGPRSPADEDGVRAVRQLLRERARPGIVVMERPVNLGLARSIISAVTELTDRFGRLIVFEDDLIVHPTALSWLNAGLNAFTHDEHVMQVSAYQYNVPEFASRSVGMFQHFTTTWGWGTWKRAWKKFDAHATGWKHLESDSALRRSFDADDSYPFSEMLIKQMTGQLDSWGIRWSWSVFRSGGITLMPPRTLVHNNGLDTMATHNSIGRFKSLVSGSRPLPWDSPSAPELPPHTEVYRRDELAFRRGLLRTNARRNAKIKRALAAAGLSRFA